MFGVLFREDNAAYLTAKTRLLQTESLQIEYSIGGGTMNMNREESDDTFVADALDNDRREKVLASLRQRRRLNNWMSWLFLSPLAFLSIAELSNHKVDFSMFAFFFVMFLFVRADCEATDTEIKILKVAGALKEAQQTKDDTASL